MSERKGLDPGTLDLGPAADPDSVGGAAAFSRSNPAGLDISHLVQIRPTTCTRATASVRVVSWLVGAAAASGLLGCGSRHDLVIGREDFTLVRHDDFDTFDLDYWERATHTFDPNLAYFTQESATVEGGLLLLSITAQPAPAMPAPNQATKPYSAAEVRTRANFLYGSFRARVRIAPGPGVVNAFWGFYDRYEMSTGAQIDNQIVIETGTVKATSEPSYRYAVNVPADAPAVVTEAAGFEPSSAFHEIGYDWTPLSVTFFVDDQPTHSISGEAATQLTQYQRLVMSAYPSQAAWLSDFDPKQLPARAEIDWVEIRSYKGPRP